MAVGAHVVPVVPAARPMLRRPMLDHLVRREREPSLALGCGARIPCDGQRLQATAAVVDEILLQGPDAEGVAHGKVGHCTVGGLRVHDEARTLASKRRRHPAMRERAAIEPAKDGIARGNLHGHRVLRCAPGGHLVTMAGHACVRSGERRGLGTASVAGRAAREHQCCNQATPDIAWHS